MPTDLWFPLQPTGVLAEHSAASAQHFPSFIEHHELRPCPGGLEWVADAGTYLMSTGRPPLLQDPNDPDSSNVAVYAEGWGPDSDRRPLGHTDVGHDDFAEHLHFNDGDPPLLRRIRAAIAQNYQWFVLNADGDDIACRFAKNR